MGKSDSEKVLSNVYAEAYFVTWEQFWKLCGGYLPSQEEYL